MSSSRRLPFFIAYDSRSGSTWLANLLMRSSDVVIAPESNFAIKFLEKWQGEVRNRSDLKKALDIVHKEKKFADWGLPRKDVFRALKQKLPVERAEFLQTVFDLYAEKNAPGSARFGIKKGNYIFQFDQLSALFPGSPWIGLIRDGRAVFRSKKSSVRSVSGQPFQTDARAAAREWIDFVRALRQAERSAPDRVLIVRYETLVEATERELDCARDFLGVSARKSHSSNGGYGVPDRYGNSLHSNIDRPALRSRIEAWRDDLSRDEIAAFESAAGDVLRLEGYSPVSDQTMSR